jgi:hypothetical protein
MPDASLSTLDSRHSPLAPPSSDRAIFDTKLPSAEVSVGAGQRLRNSITLSWKSQVYFSSSSGSLSPQTSSSRSPISSRLLAKPKSHHMVAAVPNGETRPAKVSTSTNNLFSSSCQPMRNTPNGESYAKVLCSLSCLIIL